MQLGLKGDITRADSLGNESETVTLPLFPEFKASFDSFLNYLESTLLNSAIFGSIFHEIKKQWDSSIHVATDETDIPERDVTTDGTYHFAHISDDDSLIAYLQPQLTLAQAQAAATVEAWPYYSGILQYSDIGFYTKNQEDAAKLAVLLDGSGSRPDKHTNSIGIIYPHFHDRNHDFHIWYGEPIF